MSKTVNLGLVGCGWAASEIVRASADLPSLKIVAAYDADRGRSEQLGQKAGARVAESLDALLADPAVDTIYVGLPHHLLSPTVERALNAGKHVLAEKPLSLDVGTARRLGERARQKHLKLTVFFELRCSGTVQAARKLIADGTIGAPRFIRIRTLIDKRRDYWGAPGALNWRSRLAEAGGGVLLMNTVHQLDTLRYITGTDFVRASGEIATMTAPVEVEDVASATLTLSNGGIVNLAVAAHSPGAWDGETIEIDGTRGRLDMPAPFGDGPIRLYSIAEKAWREIEVPRPDSHLKMLESFVDAIANDRPEPAGADDAAAALCAVQAIYRAAREGRTVTI